MGALTLHNCTGYKLKYWRSVAFARTTYVLPGKVGTYKWGATYTLEAERDDKNGTEGSRRAVNQNGSYYAYYSNGKIHIYSEKQFEPCVRNADNPNVSVWRPSNRTDTFEAEWRVMTSYDNTNKSVYVDLLWKEVVGFQESASSSTKVITSNKTSVGVGASFVVKGVIVDTFIQNNTTVTKSTEVMTSKTVYGENTSEMSLTVDAGASLVIWQLVADAFRLTLFLDNVVFADKDDPEPADNVDKLAVSCELIS